MLRRVIGGTILLCLYALRGVAGNGLDITTRPSTNLRGHPALRSASMAGEILGVAVGDYRGTVDVFLHRQATEGDSLIIRWLGGSIHPLPHDPKTRRWQRLDSRAVPLITDTWPIVPDCGYNKHTITGDCGIVVRASSSWKGAGVHSSGFPERAKVRWKRSVGPEARMQIIRWCGSQHEYHLGSKYKLVAYWHMVGCRFGPGYQGDSAYLECLKTYMPPAHVEGEYWKRSSLDTLINTWTLPPGQFPMGAFHDAEGRIAIVADYWYTEPEDSLAEAWPTADEQDLPLSVYACTDVGHSTPTNAQSAQLLFRTTKCPSPSTGIDDDLVLVVTDSLALISASHTTYPLVRFVGSPVRGSDYHVLDDQRTRGQDVAQFLAETVVAALKVGGIPSERGVIVCVSSGASKKLVIAIRDEIGTLGVTDVDIVWGQ